MWCGCAVQGGGTDQVPTGKGEEAADKAGEQRHHSLQVDRAPKRVSSGSPALLCYLVCVSVLLLVSTLCCALCVRCSCLCPACVVCLYASVRAPLSACVHSAAYQLGASAGTSSGWGALPPTFSSHRSCSSVLLLFCSGPASNHISLCFSATGSASCEQRPRPSLTLARSSLLYAIGSECVPSARTTIPAKRSVNCIAVGETVILLTLSLHPY